MFYLHLHEVQRYAQNFLIVPVKPIEPFFPATAATTAGSATAPDLSSRTLAGLQKLFPELQGNLFIIHNSIHFKVKFKATQIHIRSAHNTQLPV